MKIYHDVDKRKMNSNKLSCFNKTIIHFSYCGKMKGGGIGLTDTESKFKAFKAFWDPQLLSKEHCIKHFLNTLFQEVNINLITETRLDDFGCMKAMPHFYKEVLNYKINQVTNLLQMSLYDQL